MGLQRVRHDWATKHSTLLEKMATFTQHFDSSLNCHYSSCLFSLYFYVFTFKKKVFLTKTNFQSAKYL